MCSTGGTCDVCDDDYLLEPNGMECRPWFENCAASYEEQRKPVGENPLGIWKSDEDSLERWYCLECKEGFYFDPEEDRCLPCNSFMPQCDACTSSHNCTLCAGQLILEFVTYGPECLNPVIPHCAEFEPKDGRKCKTCDKFYGLTQVQDSCQDCPTGTSMGCTNCEAERFFVDGEEVVVYGECLACAENMVLVDGKCEWQQCD